MKQHQGIWLPDHEQHLIEWMDASGEFVDGRGTYQIKKLRAALGHVRQWRRAVDVGAHVGFWTMHLAKCFARVVAFEPVMEHVECWNENLEGVKNVMLVRAALGAEGGRVQMNVPKGSSGGTHIARVAPSLASPTFACRDPMDAALMTLDAFQFDDVDFLKIDCEGYELEVLKGARATLERCKPCVIVEQKPHKLGPNFGIQGTPAVDLLLAMGAKQRAVLSGDHILSWE